MTLIVGTRGSRLSIVQTESVVRELVRSSPNLEIETKVIKTTGDKMFERPLRTVEALGIFEKEIDRAVVSGEVDFAVHSMKDVPFKKEGKTALIAVPNRACPNDVLLSKENLSIIDLRSGSVIGTGSPRRQAQIYHIRPDLRVESIRGNVDKRIEKLKQGFYDAIILAEAGLQRLGLLNHIVERLSLEDFTPSPGQGALAVVARSDHKKAIDILKRINHPPSMSEVLAEKRFTQEMGGGCRIPMGAVARARGKKLSLLVAVFSQDGRRKMQIRQVGNINEPEELGIRLAKEIRRRGVHRILER